MIVLCTCAVAVVVAQCSNDCVVYVCAVAMVARHGNDCCVHVQWLWWHSTVMTVVYVCSGRGGTAW